MSEFLDRHHECEVLEALLRGAQEGRSGVLVIHGEAGIGKSALLRHLAGRAGAFRVARIAGVESEMELPFAGLQRLCAPLLDHINALPTPQQDALRVAFGLATGEPADLFLLALGVLNLLADIGEVQPLLCFIDDAQWLDRATRHVLGFVARRLLAERVVLVFAMRDEGGAELADLPSLQLGGLEMRDAHALLTSILPGLLDQSVRDRIVAETGGNPLALLELPHGFTPAELADGLGLREPVGLPGRIEESFLRRLIGLSDETRLLLLIAAAEPVGDSSLMWRAAIALDIPPLSLKPAEETGLVEVGSRVRFRHPLVRSAIYRAASDADRRRVHAALGKATSEPDRRVWHRAQAAAGADDDVAAELEESAGRAQARGGLAAAAAFLRQSASLTTDAGLRAARMLAAAELSARSGAFEAALGLLAAAEAGPMDELGHARVDLLHAQIAFAQNRGADAVPRLLNAAGKLTALQPELARDTYLDAFAAALFAGRDSLLTVCASAANAPAPVEPPRPCDLLLDAYAALSGGPAAAALHLRKAASAFAGPEVAALQLHRWGWMATAAAVCVWDYDSCMAIASRAAQLARDAGALEVLGVALNTLSQAVTVRGDFAQSAQLIAEIGAISQATGAPIPAHGALMLAAWRGREDEAKQLVDMAVANATEGGRQSTMMYVDWATALLMNALGRHADAAVAATAASDAMPEMFISPWAWAELVEAAVRIGDDVAATVALERLKEYTSVANTAWATGLWARSLALLSSGEEAEQWYISSIDDFRRTPLRPELARAQLLYGEWLRRNNRRIDAREQLRSAHEAFVAMDAEAFAERARRELAATGETARGRRTDARDDLTHQEQQIAEMARDGLSNPEIAAQLFLSPRTVEWHLRKVFNKLGITSRRALADALPDRERASA